MNRRRTLLGLPVVVLVIVGCRASGRATTPAGASVPLFDGMGTHQRAVTTSSPLAQKYFNQGLIWTFAFNHDEAIRSYRQAAALDPNCAMAWWGIALCNGPHINNPVMPPERSRAAWDALQKAVALKESATPVERALIEALTKRYADPPPSDRKALDESYAAAMRDVWKQFPKDADAGILFAEAMMDLRPWDLWTKDGKSQPGTPEIVGVLNDVLRLQPDHPGALHLHIHAVEASPSPSDALATADRLRQLVPASGHLNHMPTHIDVLTGRWALASESNQRAIKADRAYRRISPRQDFYRFYMAHNHHMLAFACMMEGRSQSALRAVRELIAAVPEDYAKTNAALMDGLMASPNEVMMRFGQWDAILREPAPPSYFPIATAMWRFTRGVAHAAKGQVNEAERERTEFQRAVTAVPKDAVVAINPAEKILAIAGHVLDGEIAYRKGDIERAVASLKEAVKIEDDLRYMEPPEWIQPVRHTLGAILLSDGRYEEAEKVYREDLKEWPENGWSLYGLAQCLRARGATAEADQVERRFRKAWSRADVTIGSSCMCVNRL